VKLPNSAHTSRPWRIHEMTRDFRVEDVWSLPTPGGPDDFPQLVELITSFDPAVQGPYPVRILFAIRKSLGQVFGWDDADSSHDTDKSAATFAFTPLYQLHDEWAAEIVNKTVHGIIHLGWVPDESGGYRGQLAVLVKRNGLLGAAYMAMITPFRYAIVYPMLTREFGRAWRARSRLQGDRT
jgi:hypothetical protein